MFIFESVKSRTVQSTRCQPLDVVQSLRERQLIHLSYENPFRQEVLEFDRIPNLSKGFNKAKYRSNIRKCLKPCAYPGEIILVTNFITLGDNKHRDYLQYEERNPTDEEIQARWLENVNTLQQNLNSKHIRTIAILVEDASAAKKNQENRFPKQSKTNHS